MLIRPVGKENVLHTATDHDLRKLKQDGLRYLVATVPVPEVESV